MAFTRIPASRMRIWRSQPGLGRVGTEPVGAIPLGLAVVFAGTLFVHASLRAIDRSPAEIHAVTVGSDIVEAQAHAAKRGIWAGTFMPPWEWRHRHSH